MRLLHHKVCMLTNIELHGTAHGQGMGQMRLYTEPACITDVFIP